MLKSSDDGINHICVSKTGKTSLGRSLDMGARRAFKHPTDGLFESFIGWWLWRSNGRKEVFRSIHHDSLMMTAAHNTNPELNIWDDAVVALTASVTADPYLAGALKHSKLPFMLYHVATYMDGDTQKESIIPITWFSNYIDVINKVKANLHPN